MPIGRVQLVPGGHFAFQVTDADGATHAVPFHRVKSAYRNGALIWHREHQESSDLFRNRHCERSAAIQNAGNINGLWIAASIRASR